MQRMNMSEQSENMAMDAGTDAVTLATELTIAWLSNPNTRAGAEEVPAFLRTMHEAVGALAALAMVGLPVDRVVQGFASVAPADMRMVRTDMGGSGAPVRVCAPCCMHAATTRLPG